MKINDENMMKSNDEILSPCGSENECMCFLTDSLNKNIPIKKQVGYLIKRTSILKCSEKQVLAKRIKAAMKRCSLKQVF